VAFGCEVSIDSCELDVGKISFPTLVQAGLITGRQNHVAKLRGDVGKSDFPIVVPGGQIAPSRPAAITRQLMNADAASAMTAGVSTAATRRSAGRIRRCSPQKNAGAQRISEE
jgi:hypothetical protein